MSKEELKSKVKDHPAHGYYSDPLMLFEHFSANLDAVRTTICYIQRCEGFAELVLVIQWIELAHRYAKVFRHYYEATLGRSPLIWKYGLTKESQFLLRSELTAQLSTSISFETVNKALLVGDGRELLIANKQILPKERDGLRAAEIFEEDFKLDTQILCFEDEPAFSIPVLAGVQRPGKTGRQYSANFFDPKREAATQFP